MIFLTIKKIFKIEGMHCNSCSQLIENALRDKGIKAEVSYAEGRAEIEFNPEKISETEIKKIVNKLGYAVLAEKDEKNAVGWIIAGISILILAGIVYFILKPFLPEIALPSLGEKTSLLLLFVAGLLTGFHCIAMCGGFVVSYTAKNAISGHTGFKQHLYYGAGKLVSYTIIGGIFGLIGGLIAFSVGLRAWIAILAGAYMIVYALGMMGVGFFRRFQPSFRFLAGLNSKISGNHQLPLITGLLNGLFLACGPLQAMYIYAAGSGGFISGASSLFAFGLGTLPVMFIFGSLTTVISHETTGKILKVSAVIVLILGLIMINRGLTLNGSSLSVSSIKANLIGIPAGINASIVNGIQEINMDVDASGYHPNSFVLKKGVQVKWNINVKQLTGCNKEIIVPEYNLDIKLKKGLQTAEFTPDKTGTFSFSCWMGMLKGSFIVTDTGTASQSQVQAATPKSGGSCGCGG